MRKKIQSVSSGTQIHIIDGKPDDTTSFKTKVNGDGKRKGKGKRRMDGFDRLDIRILNYLLKNSDIKSSEISSKLSVPLSTIQRRRSRLDKSNFLKKGYEINYQQFGLRRADIMVSVSKGDCVTIAKEIVKEYGEYVLEASITIGDPKVNLVVEVVYFDSDEIFNIIHRIKRMEHVEDARWSEIIKAVVKNDSDVVAKLISKYGNS